MKIDRIEICSSLFRFKRNGMLHRLAQKYVLKDDTSEEVLSPVPVQGIVPILSIIIGGFVVASMILVIERISHSIMNKLRRYYVKKFHRKIEKRVDASREVVMRYNQRFPKLRVNVY